jgi:NADH-quinone oxidoreductase subunit E
VACEVCDHKNITDACRAKLGIEVGETTDDGKYTLIELECLGLCEGAPACLVDHDAHMSATPESIVKAIDEAGKNGHGH